MEGNPLNIENTTGEFRFILHVKSEDNINRISSTTISIAKNYVDFTGWEDNQETYLNSSVNKTFRIYGDSEPQKILMIKVAPDDSESTGVDIIEQKTENSGSQYNSDYNVSTSGLKFTQLGENKVYFIITFENGQIIETEKKTFNVKEPVGPVKITDLSQLDDNKMYLIQSVSNNGYAYDNGTYMNVSQSYNDNNLFRIIKSGNQYIVYNIQSADYVNLDNRTLKIETGNESSAAKFTLEGNNGVFKLGIKVRANHNYLSYWQLNNNGNISVNANNDNANQQWYIYEVSN